LSVDGPGPGIFEPDTAFDVRVDFRTLLSRGQSAADATAAMVAEWVPDGEPEFRTDFWLALAAAQAELGQLQPPVRDRALQIISSGDDLPRWSFSDDLLKKRRRVLAALERKLRGPQKSPSVPRRKAEIPPLEWAPGSVYLYRLRNDACCLLRVVEVAEFRGPGWPVVEVLDWQGASVPGNLDLNQVRVMRASRAHPLKFLVVCASLREQKVALRRVVHVGHSEDYPRSTASCNVEPTTWGRIDNELSSWFAIG
jgi:hypothetical protein